MLLNLNYTGRFSSAARLGSVQTFKYAAQNRVHVPFPSALGDMGSMSDANCAVGARVRCWFSTIKSTL